MVADAAQLFLGVDGGATKTTWVAGRFERDAFVCEMSGSAPGTNLALVTDSDLRATLGALPRTVDAVGVFLAGCATDADRTRLRHLVTSLWPGAKVAIGSDRDSAHAAAFRDKDGIIVIAGTGSAVTGRRGSNVVDAGGWGHLLGDVGGGYDIALQALRTVLFSADSGRGRTPLADEILTTLGLGGFRDLVAWAQSAEKTDLARLTPLVFAHAGTSGASDILASGARSLATLTAAVADRLALDRPVVRLAGGVFREQPLYCDLFAAAWDEIRPGEAEIRPAVDPAAVGAAWLARNAPAPVGQSLPMTEAPLAQSANLESLQSREIVELFCSEERRVEEALRCAAPQLSDAIDLVSARMGAGGRLFYVGAGTSGRLGVLDASEIPPTFGLPPDRVIGLIAGGDAALRRSIEGAEDDHSAGESAMRDVGPNDVVCGISASGGAAFVHAALRAARSHGAATVFLTCNPAHAFNDLADIRIDLPTGPEILAGSTRLKAGTATKVALNILTTAVMIRLGRVSGNQMTCMVPLNRKLRDRAVRIVAQESGIDPAEAKNRLECSNWNIRSALVGPK